MRQVRRGVFETNSSSTHSLTMMMKSDYDKWNDEHLYLYSDGIGWRENGPTRGCLYTKEEVVSYIKGNDYYRSTYAIDDEFIWGMGFISRDYENEDLEQFYHEFITPSGEIVVAFGEYGYD